MAKVARKTLSRARALRRKPTDAETMLWSRLRKDVRGVRFRRQHPVGSYIADFACVRVRLIVEIDGATHSADAEREYDARRDRYMRTRGWYVLRVQNEDIYAALGDVVDSICNITLKRLG
jgi:very-short-patch-repair endonuclease